MIKRTIIAILSMLCCTFSAHAQQVAVKTNLLYWAYSYTPNLGVEIALARRSTLDVNVGYNPWNLKGDQVNNKKAVHLLGNIEYRYWLCEKFNGHFFGAHLLGSQYNISQHKLPLLFGNDSDEYRFEGWAGGAGIAYGYHLPLAKHWGLEFSVGVGYAYLKYDKYKCLKCGDKLESGSVKHYFGPTKAGVSLIYTF